jgi:Fe-S-cluster containining protein
MPPRPQTSFQAREERRTALAEVRAIYREVDARPAERNCTRLTECCQFRLTGRTPMLTRGEALLAAQAVRAAGRKTLPESREGACPLLREDGRCLIYADRPFGCRTHFCTAAGGPYARGEVLDLIRRLEAMDVRLGGSGPRALPAAVAEALAEF